MVRFCYGSTRICSSFEDVERRSSFFSKVWSGEIRNFYALYSKHWWKHMILMLEMSVNFCLIVESLPLIAALLLCIKPARWPPPSVVVNTLDHFYCSLLSIVDFPPCSLSRGPSTHLTLLTSNLQTKPFKRVYIWEFHHQIHCLTFKKSFTCSAVEILNYSIKSRKLIYNQY